MAMLNRRFMLSAMSGAVAFTTLTGFGGFKLPGLPGLGGGGGSWTGIVKDWKSGLTIMVKQVVQLGKAQADLADALGLKKQAALLRAEVEALEKGGDTISGSKLKEAAKISISTQADINDRIKSTKKLSADEKAAVGKAGLKIAPAMIQIGKATFILIKASVAAAQAGAPSPIDAITAGPTAIQIPELIPAAAEVIPKLFDVSSDFRKLAAEKEIAVPDMGDAPEFA